MRPGEPRNTVAVSAEAHHGESGFSSVSTAEALELLKYCLLLQVMVSIRDKESSRLVGM